jgi:hypothetical protein
MRVRERKDVCSEAAVVFTIKSGEVTYACRGPHLAKGTTSSCR